MGSKRFIVMSLTLRSLCTFLFDSNRFKPSECLRAIEHHKNFALAFLLITSSLSINHLHCRASRMGANFPSLFPKLSEANSELLLLFLKVTKVFTRKLPRRIERKRDSIEFERSENQGQFFMVFSFYYFNSFKRF